MQIEDGKGSGKKAWVDSQNRLVVNSRSESIQHYTSQEEQNAYQVLNVLPFSSGENTLIHITNNDSNLDLVVTFIRHQVVTSSAVSLPSVDDYFKISFGRSHVEDESGIEIIPVNVFNGSGKAAAVTAHSGSPNLEGVAVEIDRWYTKEVGDMNLFNKRGAVVIGTGNTIEFSYISSGTGIIYTRVSFLMMPKN
jgi:hypothetical protein